MAWAMPPHVGSQRCRVAMDRRSLYAPSSLRTNASTHHNFFAPSHTPILRSCDIRNDDALFDNAEFWLGAKGTGARCELLLVGYGISAMISNVVLCVNHGAARTVC